jgi:hypothetical protein
MNRQRVYEIFSRDGDVDLHRGVSIGADPGTALLHWLASNVAWNVGALLIEEADSAPWNYQVRGDDQPGCCYRVQIQD